MDCINEKIKINISKFFLKIKKDKHQDLDKMKRFIKNHIFKNDSILFIKYILHNKNISKDLKEYFIGNILILSVAQNKKEIYEYLIKSDYFNFNKKDNFHIASAIFKNLLIHKNIDMINFIFENYKTININNVYPIIFNYFYYPRLTNEQIIYFLDNKLELLNKEMLFHKCLMNTDLEIMKYLYSKGIFYKFKEIGSFLTSSGIEYLRWAYSIDKEIFYNSDFRKYFFIPRYGFYKNLKVFDFIFEIKKVTEDELVKFVKNKSCIIKDFEILKYLARKIEFANDYNYIKFLCEKDKENLIATQIIRNYKGKSNNIKDVIKSSIRAVIKTNDSQKINDYINFAIKNNIITQKEKKNYNLS